MTKNEDLKITISGTAGSGKTTMALMIADVLIRYGIDVSIEDDVENEIEDLSWPGISMIRRSGTLSIETRQINKRALTRRN